MNTKIRSILAAASVLALSALTANAQLQLNSITSTYTNLTPVGSATIVHGGIAGTTGVGYTDTLTEVWAPTNVNQLFGISSTLQHIGTTWNLGDTNSIDSWVLNRQLGAATAGQLTFSYDIRLDLDFGPLGGTDVSVAYHVQVVQTSGTAIGYAITPINVGGQSFGGFPVGTEVSGLFTVSGTTYGYTFTGSGLSGGLNASNAAVNGTAGIDFTLSRAVPEPSTYALFGVVGLMGVVAIRRIRSSKKVA